MGGGETPFADRKPAFTTPRTSIFRRGANDHFWRLADTTRRAPVYLSWLSLLPRRLIVECTMWRSRPA